MRPPCNREWRENIHSRNRGGKCHQYVPFIPRGNVPFIPGGKYREYFPSTSKIEGKYSRYFPCISKGEKT